MQAIYCTQCGSKNIYSGEKPKFCSSCGSPINGQASSEKKTPKKTLPKKNERAEASEDYSDVDYVPDVRSLEYEISSDSAVGYQTYNMRDLVDGRKTQEEAKKENQ